MAKSRPEIDERYVDEWVGFGMKEMGVFLTKRANFADWCDSHNRQGYDGGGIGTSEGSGGRSRRGGGCGSAVGAEPVRRDPAS